MVLGGKRMVPIDPVPIGNLPAVGQKVGTNLILKQGEDMVCGTRRTLGLDRGPAAQTRLRVNVALLPADRVIPGMRPGLVKRTERTVAGVE